MSATRTTIVVLSRASSNSVATELPGDAAGKREKQESSHNQCGNLNPAVRPERLVAYRGAEPGEAGAEQVLQHEHRDKKHRGGRASPRCLPRRTAPQGHGHATPG